MEELIVYIVTIHILINDYIDIPVEFPLKVVYILTYKCCIAINNRNSKCKISLIHLKYLFKYEFFNCLTAVLESYTETSTRSFK